MNMRDLRLMELIWKNGLFSTRVPSGTSQRILNSGDYAKTTDGACPRLLPDTSDAHLSYGVLPDHKKSNRFISESFVDSQAVPVLENANLESPSPFKSSEAIVPSMIQQENPQQSGLPDWNSQEEPHNTKEKLNFPLFRRWIRVKEFNKRSSHPRTRSASNLENNHALVPTLIETVVCSEGVTNSKSAKESITKVDLVQPDTSKPKLGSRPPDEQSEAEGCRGSIKSRVIASSCAWSCGASHNPSYGGGSSYQDAKALADNVGEEPARSRKGPKRKRSAGVCDLSKRRQRRRLSKKMRALNNLIPNCNKTDEASMLDEAIDYLKTLQLQLQMMATGNRSWGVPIMIPRLCFPHPNLPYMAHLPSISAMPGMAGPRPTLGLNDQRQLPYMPHSAFSAPLGCTSAQPVDPLQLPRTSSSPSSQSTEISAKN